MAGGCPRRIKPIPWAITRVLRRVGKKSATICGKHGERARVHIRPPATRGYYCALVRGGSHSFFFGRKKGLRAHARASERVQKKERCKTSEI